MQSMSIGISMDEELHDLYGGVTAAIERITREVALEYLKRNVGNRPVSRSHTDHFEAVFRDRDMVLNGETIIFTSDGFLLNGQHRLIACANTGIPFDVLVVRGIDTEAFKTLDGGRKRSTADALGMAGEKYTTNLTAAIGSLIHFVDAGGEFTPSSSQQRRVTPAVAERVLAKHPKLRGSVAAMMRSSFYNVRDGYVLHYLFGRVARELADELPAVLAEGHPDIGRPFVRLRESLIGCRVTPQNRRAVAAKTIKAFNAELAGERPRLLRFGSSEQFPVIDGLDYDGLKRTV